MVIETVQQSLLSSLLSSCVGVLTRTTPGVSPWYLSENINVAIIGDSITDYNVQANSEYPIGYIANISNSNPCQITTVDAHGASTGDVVYFSELEQITQLNGTTQTITYVDANNYTLDGIDSTNWDVYDAGNKTGRVFTEYISGYAKPIRGYFNQAQMMTGQRLNWDRDRQLGVASETSANILARFDYSLLPRLNAKTLVILAGTNDFSSGVAAVDVEANVTAMIAKAQAYGIKHIILGVVPPRNTDTTAMKTERAAFNTWVRAQASSLISVWDFEDDVSTAHNSFTWKAGYSTDGIHPIGKGSFVIGRSLAAIINAKYGHKEYAVESGNKIVNNNFSGTAGSANVAFTNNGCAASWTWGTANSTNPAYRTLSKGASDEQELTLAFPSGLTNNEATYVQQDVLAANLTVGIWYAAKCKIKLSDYGGVGDLTQLGLYLNSQTAGILSAANASVSGTPSDPHNTQGMVDFCSSGEYLVLQTFAFRMDSSFTKLTAKLDIRANCTTNGLNLKVSIFDVEIFEVPNPFV